MLRSVNSALLALEDGTIYRGFAIGAAGEAAGEVVFNTSMTGYQEILTDPSYHGQIVTMTYTEIGNYGTNEHDVESDHPQVAAFVVRADSRLHSNFRSQAGLSDYLKQHNIVAISGVDTRALVRHIRSHGAMKGMVSTTDLDEQSLVEKARKSPSLVGRDLVREVVPAKLRSWNEALYRLDENRVCLGEADASKPHIVCLDFGMKWNIPRHLFERGNRVTILPGTATASEVLDQKPDGIFLSNGPGDPEPLDYAIKTIRELIGQRPIFGICLGHQLLSLAAGAKTFKLKFGHRGSNQPVLNVENGRVEITSQNHGFAVEEASLPADLTVTHRNLHDDTIAGVRHRTAPAFSVQYHPEASAGPHDSQYLFDQFQQSL
ncbi:MAG: glutamine-hydrolyzing carbamoyl-phosphate synthase small subunit [Pirellulaceae bacterium]